MGPVLIAGLAFATVVGVVMAVWWLLVLKRSLDARLAAPVASQAAGFDIAVGTLHAPGTERSPVVARMIGAFAWLRRLETLTEQAGWKGKTGLALGLIAFCACVGGIVGVARTNSWIGGLVCAVSAGALPVFYLRYRKQKRLETFSEQFPEALDMLTRALRTGYAVGASFQMVAEEMPEPVGSEFRRVFDQISLGRPTVEALQEMYDRIRTEDVRFFYVAVGIQREVGGNLAEILEKLADVVRERYKLLAFAQTLSAQQRASAYCVAASPFAVALLLMLTSPGWFDPMWEWRYGMHVALGALGMQALGFVVLKRIANITV